MSPQAIGGLVALASSLSWALGSILFRGLANHTSALGLNLNKGLLGVVYLSVGMAFVGFSPMEPFAFGMLLLSGIISIAIGDTLFFMALVRLEPRRCVLLATVGHAMTIGIAMTVLGERPSLLTFIGIAAIIAGVSWVMLETAQNEGENTKTGVWLGLGAAACMSIGIITAKIGVGSVDPLQATWVRMVAGVVGLSLAGLFTGHLGTWLQVLRKPNFLRKLAIADVAIIGGGFYLSMLALSLTDASIVSVLGATEPIFILPLAAWMSHEKLTKRSILGAIVATVGVACIMIPA
jgi:drug/metabolite transporter (DMT)-like permease